MPTKIHQYGSEGSRQEERRRRRQVYTHKGVTIQAPFLGYCPDLPPHLAAWKTARDCVNVVPGSVQRRGQFLTHEDGYKIVNNGVVDPTGAATGSFNYFTTPGGSPVSGVGSFATAAGSPTTTTQSMVILNHVVVSIHKRTGTGTWSQLTPDDNITDGVYPIPTADTRFDVASYPFGAPTRTYTDTAGVSGAPGGNHSGITDPVFVMAGGDHTGPTVPVLITPNSAGLGTEYSELWEADFAGDLSIPAPLLAPFMCKSVEVWDGRLYFFNTKEGGVAYPNRLRGTAVGTADASNEEIGSVRVDFKGAQRQGLRAETIGDQLACYFEEGVLLLQRTGRFTDPVRWRIISEERGLLSTHALTPISNTQHFGVFTDGWWIVDAGGRWTPVGTIEVPESGNKSTIYYKFRETFAELLDPERRHLVTTGYDPMQRRVRVSFPIIGQDRLETWSYDIDTDSVWPLGHDIDVSIWGSFDQLIKTAETYGDYVGVSYGDVEVAQRTYGSFGARFGLAAPFHGDHIGAVYSWDSDIYTRDFAKKVTGSSQWTFTREAPKAYYHTHSVSVTEDPHARQVLTRVNLEYMDLAGPGVSITSETNSGRRKTTRSKPLTNQLGGQVHSVHGTFYLGGTHHDVQLSLTAPFAVRSFRPEFRESDDEHEMATPQ